MLYAPSSHSLPRIAIIGGGISGLAAAHRLAELLPNAQLKLFEASGRLGGVLDTVQVNGFLIERSADNFLTHPPTAVDLCGQLGIADELLPTDDTRRRAFVVKDGKLLPIPDGFYLMSPRKLAPLLASPLLSWRGKLRLLAEPFISRGPVATPSSSGRGQGEGALASEDESVASFARRRLGRETYERLVQPLVAGIYTADPEQLSMAATMPQFLEYEREHGSLLRATLRTSSSGPNRSGPTGQRDDPMDPTLNASGARYSLFAAPNSGMTSVVNALADRLPANTIQLNTRVANISRAPDNRWLLLPLPPGEGQVEGLPGEGRGEGQSFDALIIATPAHAAAKLLEACDAELAAELAAIPYAGCAVVSFGLARHQIGHELNGFGLVVPQVERRRIIAASFASQKFPGRAPDDSVLIRVFVGGALQPELLQLSDPDLGRIALEELSSLLNVNGDPQITDIARWPASMPQYHVGHRDRIARIELLAARHPNLALAGNAYHGVGIPQCIASGQQAAERIASWHRNPSGFCEDGQNSVPCF
jgi:oxygen-dependent protoporphyrinogen oxidase